ncbi:hypothetical protein AX16_004527, partial [Volvariella volvacea WC 439]
MSFQENITKGYMHTWPNPILDLIEDSLEEIFGNDWRQLKRLVCQLSLVSRSFYSAFCRLRFRTICLPGSHHFVKAIDRGEAHVEIGSVRVLKFLGSSLNGEALADDLPLYQRVFQRLFNVHTVSLVGNIDQELLRPLWLLPNLRTFTAMQTIIWQDENPRPSSRRVATSHECPWDYVPNRLGFLSVNFTARFNTSQLQSLHLRSRTNLEILSSLLNATPSLRRLQVDAIYYSDFSREFVLSSTAIPLLEDLSCSLDLAVRIVPYRPIRRLALIGESYYRFTDCCNLLYQSIEELLQSSEDIVDMVLPAALGIHPSWKLSKLLEQVKHLTLIEHHVNFPFMHESVPFG